MDTALVFEVEEQAIEGLASDSEGHLQPSQMYLVETSGQRQSMAILDKKLAASVNILPKTSSLYFLEGEIEESTEILLLIKTKTSKVSRLSTYMRLAHPFEIPEVFSIPMDQGDARYLKWLEEGMKEN